MVAVIRLYDTATATIEAFEPRESGKVSMYVCGPTVYGPAHIGHGRMTLVFDVLRRYLEWSGFEVTHVSNVTDIDDQIITKANDEGRTTAEVAGQYEREWFEAMDAIGVARPHHSPRATEWVEQMVALIEDLFERGVAYETSDGVYLDVAKVDGYGLLARQDLDSLKAGARIEASDEKRSPVDFVLWKKSKPGEPSWPSPWGEGRPGWHTECVVMSLGLLSDGFDLHGGGIDLRFPHHENERAQAVAVGRTFARHWMHNGFVEVEGEKMSKSLGNYITMENFFSEYGDSDQLKLIFLSAHYRKSIDLTKDRILEAARVKERLVIFMEKAARLRRSHGSVKPLEELQVKMTEAMDEDLNTPKAFKILMEAVGKGNEAFAAGEDMGPDQVEQILACSELVREWTELFGLTLEPEAATEEERERIEELIALRAEARAQKDYEKSDRIRDEMAAKGVTIEDTEEGTVWRKN